MTADDQAAQDDLWQWLQPPADEAQRLRDQGVEMALNAADLRARGAAEAALRDLAESGVVFTSDDLHERVGSPLACSGAVMGSLFLAAAKRGEIEHVAYVKSRRPTSHGREIKSWRGTGRTPPMKPAKPAKPLHAERSTGESSQLNKAGQWTTGEVPEPCVRCGAPAFMRLDGRPRHKTDCAA